jgi:hypothetical protein
VDIGGTFTDAALEGPGGLATSAKVLTTHAAPEEGVMRAAEAVLAAAKLGFGDLALVVHGPGSGAVCAGAGAGDGSVAPPASQAARSACCRASSSPAMRRSSVPAVSKKPPSRVARWGCPSISKTLRCMDRRWTWAGEAGGNSMPQALAAAI